MRRALLLAVLACGAGARRKLKVGMIPTTYPPWTVVSAEGNYTGGFFTEFYREMGVVGDFDIEFVPITDPGYFLDFTGVTKKALDSKAIDLAFDTTRSLTPGYLTTTPILTFHLRALLRKTTEQAQGWQVFAPFSRGLWAMFGASVAYGALVMLLLRKLESGATVAESARAVPSLLYHTASALLGGDEYDLYHTGAAGRLYRVGLLFLVLTFSATYTANLAAHLTNPAFMVHGPQTVDALKQATVCTRWTSGIFVGFAGRGWVAGVRTPPDAADGTPMSTADREPWARGMLQRGECAAIVEIGVNAQRESLLHCDTMHLAPNIEIEPIHDYQLMRDDDLGAWREVSDAILKVLGTPAYSRMVHENMRFGQTCGDRHGSDTDKITVEQMSGAFIIFGACGLLAVVLTALHRHAVPPAKPCVLKTEVQNEKLDAKLDRVLAQLRAMERAAQKKAAPGLGDWENRSSC